MSGADPSDLLSLPLFDSLAEPELADVAPWFEVREVAAGVKLVGAGATDHSFFVIGDGQVAVTVDGEEIATLDSG